ncbi:hypothetical protein QR680_010527 [Steinernema hermaphroditum]|uniref:Uncharacterized protein n=1 Tax=Steinernema hermaphroditum TaxID=289476 RepID=A0AA39MBW4_9BILA|nr:hypothetical protein QR680_010527 [Steinernema hermaphroditum]
MARLISKESVKVTIANCEQKGLEVLLQSMVESTSIRHFIWKTCWFGGHPSINMLLESNKKVTIVIPPNVLMSLTNCFYE